MFLSHINVSLSVSLSLSLSPASSLKSTNIFSNEDIKKKKERRKENLKSLFPLAMFLLPKSVGKSDYK